MERLVSDLSRELQTLETQGLHRRLTVIEAVRGPIVRIQGREVVCWCSNDYLGLSLHPRVAAAAGRAMQHWGVGARASRLLAGTTALHEALESALAAWFRTEAAIVYSSGYLANLGTLGALLSSRDAVFVDQLAHASLLDAARATGAAFRVFRHNDAAHLEGLLARRRPARRTLVITEGVFSMEGDVAPLRDLVEVAERAGALLYVDDAHGAFVLGASGRGTPEHAGVGLERLLYMGTLGKALGCQGGFVAGPRPLIALLHNRARTFLYATAMAIPVVAAVLEALEVLAQEPDRRATLQARVQQLHEALGAWRPRREPSHIVPMVVGDSGRAKALAAALWERGCWAPAIRPPTVPNGTARIRLSVTALHTEEQVDQLVAALHEVTNRHPRITKHQSSNHQTITNLPISNHQTFGD